MSELIRLGQSQAGTPILGGFPGEREVPGTVVLVLVTAAYDDLPQLLHSRGTTARVRYARVGVGSIVPPPTLRQRAGAEYELSWVSARPGS